MYFKNQKFLVAGVSSSGVAAARFLLARGAEVYVWDDASGEGVRRAVAELCSLGAKELSAEGYEGAARECDVLVLSPGIPIDNALPVAFRRMGKLITGEEELAFSCLRATAIAVTGTNGKTTTVSMLAEVLKACSKNCVACGNIGEPTINCAERLGFGDFAVAEISSFQLETLSGIRPHIAIVTNIAEDHLDRHYNMENYIYLKSKLVRGLRESEFAVLNYDDERVRAFANITKAQVVWFSAVRKVDGAYAEDGGVYWCGERLFACSELSAGGVHNLYNALACVAAAATLGLDKRATSEALCAFKGVRHRIEKAAERNGVTYIDDSKGTNVDATLKAVQTMTAPTILLLGGRDKGYDYDRLFEGLRDSRVIHAVLYGENRYKLLSSALACDFRDVSVCRRMAQAVMLAESYASPGECVLLSPASSSFDEFSNFEERGDEFARLVGEARVGGAAG